MSVIRKRNIIIVALIAAVMFLIAYKVDRSYHIDDNVDIVSIEEGWTLEAGGFFYENLYYENISRYIKKTDSITLSFVMPETGIYMPAMAFRTNHEVVTVSANGEVIYKWGNGYYDANDFLPNMYHTINLCDVHTGDTVEISLVTDHGAAAVPDKVQVGNINDLVAAFVSERSGGMYCGLFMCVFAFFVIALLPIMILFGEKDYFLLCCGISALEIGAYILSYSDVLLFFTSRPLVSGMIEYISLYSGCIVFNLIMNLVRGEDA